MKQIKIAHLLQYFLSKIRINIANSFKIQLRFKHNAIYAVGAYHGLNVGDMSMGLAIQAIAREFKKDVRLLSIEKAFTSTELKSNKCILGGGAILSPENLRNLIEKVENDPKRVAILGVDLHLNHDSEGLKFLKDVAFVASRMYVGEDKKENFYKRLARTDIAWHPDLSFALYSLPTFSKEPLNKPKRKKIGINVFPFFYKRYQREWVFDIYSDKNPYNPSVNLSTDEQVKIADRYAKLMRQFAQNYIAKGFSVYHVPFALEDSLFAKYCFSGLPVKFYAFANNPYQVLSKICEFDRFIPTRLHAHIFSAILKVPFVSICYGVKCRNLLNYLDVPERYSINYRSFLDTESYERKAEAICKSPGFVCRDEELLRLSLEARSVIEKTIKTE